MLNWKGPGVRMCGRDCKRCGQSREGEIGIVSLLSLDRGWDCQPGVISQVWRRGFGQLGFKKFSFLLFLFFPSLLKFVKTTKLKGGFLFHDFALGGLLIFWVIWETKYAGEVTVYPMSQMERDSKRSLAYSLQTDSQAYFIHGRTWMSLSEDAFIL